MSNLANAIDQLLNEHGRTAADLSRLTGITPAQISRWINGDQISIKPDCLKRLADGFSNSLETHARLLFATLQDCRTGPGSKYVLLKLNLSRDMTESEHGHKINLPPADQRDLDIIANRISHNRDVRDLIRAVADLCRRNAPTPHEPIIKFQTSQNPTGVVSNPLSSSVVASEMKTFQTGIEMPIKSKTARQLLGIGPSLFSAIKNKMGLRNRKIVIMSHIQKWILEHPNFREVDVYHRPNCGCEPCIVKRMNPNRRKRRYKANSGTHASQLSGIP
jgi:transcriptional regulator with XRE-family HTH domain